MADIKNGDTWIGKTKPNKGRELIITSYDSVADIVQIHEHGAHQPKRTMRSDSLRANWELKGAPPKLKREPRAYVPDREIAHVPSSYMQESLELQRRSTAALEAIAPALKELAQAWSKG